MPALSRGRIRFTPHDRAIHRICEQRGWTPAKFHALSQELQIELLARDWDRQQRIVHILDGLTYMEDGKSIVKDFAAYFLLYLETL